MTGEDPSSRSGVHLQSVQIAPLPMRAGMEETTASDNAVRLTAIMFIGVILGSKIKGRFQMVFRIVALRTPLRS